MTDAPPEHIVRFAVEAAARSPCRSKRGAAIWNPAVAGSLISLGYNRQIAPFTCDGTDKCKSHCRQTAIHAEQAALLDADGSVAGMEMLHVKVVDGALVPSGVPSCVACSKLIAAVRLEAMWLYQADGWRRYDVEDFHLRSVAATLASMR
jgi:deoxycytidylate deaminase